MATRRIISDQKTVLEKDDATKLSPPASTKSNISPAVPTSVIIKLLGYTAAMVTAPIGTYFLTLNTIFHGSTTAAGATAAVIANVVLIAYIIAAFKEDQGDREEAERLAKKAE